LLYSFVNKRLFGLLSILKNGYYTSNTKAKGKLISMILKEAYNDDTVLFSRLYDLTGKFLVVTITNYLTGANIYCSYYTTPYISVFDAVNVSSNIQNIFEPIYLPIPDVPRGYYYDGGVSQGYPIDALMNFCSKNYYGLFVKPGTNIDLDTNVTNVLGIKYNDISSSTNHYNNKNIVNVPPEANMPITKVIKTTNNTLIINEYVFLTEPWLNISTELYDQTQKNFYQILTTKQMIQYYNNGCNYAVIVMIDYQNSNGENFNS